MKITLFSLLRFFKKIHSLYSPRYPFRIESTVRSKNRYKYEIAAFSEQRPFFLCSEEIVLNKKIAEKFSPNELLFVMKHYLQEKEESKRFHIKEFNRDGTYLIKNDYEEFVISGENFVANMEIMSRTDKIDIYRIISNHYFSLGRNMEKAIQNKNISVEKSDKKNIFLKIVK